MLELSPNDIAILETMTRLNDGAVGIITLGHGDNEASSRIELRPYLIQILNPRGDPIVSGDGHTLHAAISRLRMQVHSHDSRFLDPLRGL